MVGFLGGGGRGLGAAAVIVRTAACALVAGVPLVLWVAMATAAGSSGWSVQPTPFPAALYSVLNGVSCPSANSCTAVGYFTKVDGTTRTLAERFDGARWVIQPTPNPEGAPTSSLDGVSCASRNSCTAVGVSTRPDGTAVTLAERFNGARWAIQPTPDPVDAVTSSLLGVSCVSTTSCTAVGVSASPPRPKVTLAERFDGTRWAIQPTSNPAHSTDSRLVGVSCASRGSCTAVGLRYFPRRPSTEVPLAERLNGARWAIQPTPNPAGSTFGQFGGVACARHSCTAAGFYTDRADIQVPLAERFNAARWAIQPTPSPAGASLSGLNALSCVSLTSCSAVGFSTIPAYGEMTLAERMNGTRWSIEPTPPAGTTPSDLLGVSCPSANSCTAVGFSTNPDGTTVVLAERFVGGP